MGVLGYASATSVRPGDTLDLHLSADPAGPYALEVVRFGSGTPTVPMPRLMLSSLPPVHPKPWENGFGWPVAHTFRVPADWPTGLYLVKHAGETVLTVVVRSPAPGADTKVLLQISVNTPQAYNSAGGRNLYDTLTTRGARASKVSFDRPENVGRFEDGFISWLESARIAVDYCTSIDLDDGSAQLERYNLLLVVGHDEYWSKPMRDRVEAFVRNGGNVAFFSGNTCMRQVRFENDRRTMVCYKAAGSDPASDNDDVTVDFAHPPTNRPQNRLLGVGFDHGGWRGPSDFGDFTVRFPDHWLFAGLDRPVILPAGLVGYECDAADYVDDEGYPRVTGHDGSPLTFTILATSDVRHWQGKPGRATMGIYSRNGTVFNAATVQWSSLLPAEPTLQRITRNVIERLSRRSAWDAFQPVGAAPDVVALTGIEGRLFAATSDDRLLRRFRVVAEVPWKDIGHAPQVRAMAASGNKLYGVSADNTLHCRDVIESDVSWTVCGSGPAGGVRALAAAGGMLYAIDATGTLWARAAATIPKAWVRVPPMVGAFDRSIQALTSYGDILFAATSDNRLVRTDWDVVWESTRWVRVLTVRGVTGLACIEGTLFAATADGRLSTLDIRGLRRP